MLKNKNNFLLLLASLVSVASIAQTNTIAVKPATTNYMEVLMITVATTIFKTLLLIKSLLNKSK